jgi:propionate CoA-transferase
MQTSARSAMSRCLSNEGEPMRVVTADEAASLVESNDTIVIGGSGGGHAVPEALIAAIERRFLKEGLPRGITSLHPVGLGDRSERGASRFAHPGLLKRIVCGTLVDSPKVEAMALADQVEAYTLPQGAISQLMREMAAGRPGLITHVGLHTFVDPRHGGGRQSPRSTDDLVERVTVGGREWLFYKPFKIDVALLRGTTADEDGNVTMEQEAIFGEMMSMAQAARAQGGVVIVQVKRLAQRGTLPAKQVKIPGMLVDLVVVDPEQRQTYASDYNPTYAGELKVPLSQIAPMPFDPRKVIARRAAMELVPGAICNLGSGISTGIATVAAEEGVLDRIVLTNEQGLIGGAPASGNEVGASRNYWAMVDQPYQFDFYDGGGLDLAFLSFAEVDRDCNVNVSRFGDRIIGPGGFINISQGAKKMIFSGTFTAGGLKLAWPGGRLQVLQEGREAKFVEVVTQLSFSGRYSRQRGQEVIYVTERAVFRATDDGLMLTEIAPGADLDRDILAHMGFRPLVAPDLVTMDERLFRPEAMNLVQDLSARAPAGRSARLKRLVAE